MGRIDEMQNNYFLQHRWHRDTTKGSFDSSSGLKGKKRNEEYLCENIAHGLFEHKCCSHFTCPL